MTTEHNCCPIVELRQYTLRSTAARETLIELFEREFVESQEAVGMTVIGTFRDLQKPDRFIWLRGFKDMESRAAQLQQFYGGPVWKKHREAANATMIDSDNVLLLRPAAGSAGFDLTDSVRPAVGAAKISSEVVVAVIHHLKPGTEAAFAQQFHNLHAPILREHGLKIAAQFVSEHHPNTFPALPVREDANVFVWFSPMTNSDALEPSALTDVSPDLRSYIIAKPELLLLEPTSRSLLRASWP